MASLDYLLNPLFTIRECSSCGALYNKSCGCSKGGLIDKFVRDPNKTPDSSQRPPILCVKCGNPVEGPSCQGCALWRRILKINKNIEREQNQPEVYQELLLKLINDLQILKGIQQEKKKPTAQSSIPYWNSSMIDDEEARDNFLKDVCTFLRKFSRIPFGVTPKVILIAWESFGKIKDALMDKQYRQEDIKALIDKLLEDGEISSEEFSEYILINPSGMSAFLRR
ncbi:hypothetical protein Tco_1041227 [Tanacetum coccineum]|uniref:Uncharacterized protein n=1 Tax=Tanacetum coccineum TaxID=301880 RepID=A0ABQ5GHT8_9ASTR